MIINVSKDCADFLRAQYLSQTNRGVARWHGDLGSGVLVDCRDRIRYTFHIRVDAKWSNGEPAKAANDGLAPRRSSPDRIGCHR